MASSFPERAPYPRPVTAACMVSVMSVVAAPAAEYVAVIDGFSSSPAIIELSSVGSQTESGALGASSLFAGGTRTLSLEVTAAPPSRYAGAEVLVPISRFIFSVGPGVEASGSLRYEPPTVGGFDLTLGDQADAFGFTIEYSQTPVRIDLTVEGAGSLTSSMTVVRQAVSAPTLVVFHFGMLDPAVVSSSEAFTLTLSGVDGAGPPT